MPEHVCDVAGCEQGFATMAEVVAHERTHRRQCAHTIDSLGNGQRRGKGNRPWWRRTCKRWAVPGGRYCWQHGG